MSLSQLIIYGSLEELKSGLSQKPPLNEVDEYGYTPLIQTAIIDDIDKAKLLIEAGADVQFTDLTGRSALHWTVDNHNLPFSELLLKHKADPNAYTRAGQPVLVMPVLRHHEDTKNLLYQYGARLSFAQDFINAKLLGHRFELQGRIDIIDTKNTFIEMEFEGFYLEFNLAIVASSLIDFCRNFGGKHLKAYFSKLQKIIKRIHSGSELIRYQHYLTKVESYQKEINALLDDKPLLIPIACDGHAINFIRYGDWFVRCDRGEYGRKHGTVIVYKMRDPHILNKTYIKKLLYTRQQQAFIDEGLPKQLKLEKMTELPLSAQISGNCSWANVEAVVPAMLLLFLMDQGKQDKVFNLEKYKKQALYVHEEWINWDKNRALHFCIESFYQTDDPARKATKAATLGAILFQRIDFDNPLDRQKAEKILAILTIPEYEYILKSYVSVFSQDKGNKRYQELGNFLDDVGLNIEKFKEIYDW